MRRETKKYLYDIQVSIDSIFEFLGKDSSLAQYKSDKLIRRAVERELEIIGEATNKLLKIEPGINISNARRIVNLRNWVIHAYDNVDDTVIWGVIDKDLPLLKKQVNILLAE